MIYLLKQLPVVIKKSIKFICKGYAEGGRNQGTEYYNSHHDDSVKSV